MNAVAAGVGVVFVVVTALLVAGAAVPRWRRRTRLLTGGVYVASGVFNLAMTVPSAGAVYDAFREMTWWSVYARIIDGIAPAPWFLVLVALFEIAAGAMVLAGGRWARLGLPAMAAFVLLLIPALAWPYWTCNVVLAAAHLGLWSTVAVGVPRSASASTPRTPKVA